MNRAERRAAHRTVKVRAKFDGTHAIRNSQPTRPAEVARILAMLRASYERMRTGAAESEDWERLAAVAQVAGIRAEAIDPYLEGVMVAFGAALDEAAAAHRASGTYALTVKGINALDFGLEAYEQILAASSPNQMQAAVEEGMRRIMARPAIP